LKNIFDILGINAVIDDIDLYMTPVDTFGLFECRGDMQSGQEQEGALLLFLY
jgi:hypothetical protein